MPDEYLWDRTGAPDPEVERLESLLAGYRCRAPERRTRWNARAAIGLAASVVLIASATFWLASRRAPGTISEWQISGKPVAVGQTIETRGDVGAKLEAPAVGEVTLDPNSRLQVLASNNGDERMALRRGTMHALIWAPPSRFVVDTPSAKTIDLGCSYTLTVLGDDSGLLTVQTGWVAFQAGPLESFIPAGAACRTRPHAGPGLPYFEDAPTAFREAVSRFDAGKREALETIVATARKQDAITLWHLVARTSGTDRGRVVGRFASLVPGVDTAGLNAGNSKAIDQAWDLLGLGGADWWRTWKRGWSGG